jgi:alkaline phosphatase D
LFGGSKNVPIYDAVREREEFAGTEGWVPAQTLKVAANQAWFEYQPARVLPPGSKLDTFNAPQVVDTPVKDFDDTGLGTEPNNLGVVDRDRSWETPLLP